MQLALDLFLPPYVRILEGEGRLDGRFGAHVLFANRTHAELTTAVFGFHPNIFVLSDRDRDRGDR